MKIAPPASEGFQICADFKARPLHTGNIESKLKSGEKKWADRHVFCKNETSPAFKDEITHFAKRKIEPNAEGSERAE